MKKNKLLILTTAVCLLPILLGLALYGQLPELLPTHFNAAGEVNGTMPKLLAILGLPTMMAALNFFVNFMLRSDPKRANAAKTLVALSLWLLPAISIMMMTATYCIGLGYHIPMNVLPPVLVGVIFIVCGNYLPKCKQNYTVGIKLPWTLNSEENWNKTHHMAGYLWVVAGVLMVLASLLGGALWLPFLLPLIAIMVLVPTIYSYLLYKKGI